MPIEIRQVVIRAQIPDQRGAGPSATVEESRSGADVGQEQFVQRVVDQVMQILDDRCAR